MDIPVLIAERDRYREALEKIANQGLGRWDHERRVMVDNNGDAWRHWAQRAEEALGEV